VQKIQQYITVVTCQELENISIRHLQLLALSSLALPHRYLMGRLPLHGRYLWSHVLSTAPSFILWWWKFEILFDLTPLPQFFLPKRAALSTNSNGTQSAHNEKGVGGDLDTILMSMVLIHAQHLWKSIRSIVFRWKHNKHCINICSVLSYYCNKNTFISSWWVDHKILFV
jgi:hypothetical protein